MSTHQTLTEALDHCLALLRQGRSIDACLSFYQEHARALQPLLEAADLVQRVPPPVQSAEAVTLGRERMMAALKAKHARVEHAQAPQQKRRQGLFGFWKFRSLSLLLRGAVSVALALAIVAAAMFLDAGPMRWRSGRVAALAVLTHVEGKVLLRPSGTRTWMPALDGDALEVGDRVRVTRDAQARLAFPDGSSSELRSDAELAMVRLASSPEDEAATVVYQGSGDARYWVSPRGDTSQTEQERRPTSTSTPKPSTFEVHTPAVVARGTNGIVSLSVASDGTTTVRGEEGEFVVAAGEVEQVVAPGETTTVKAPDDAAQVGGENSGGKGTPVADGSDSGNPDQDEGEVTGGNAVGTEERGTLTPEETTATTEAERTETGTPAPTDTPLPSPTATEPPVSTDTPPPAPTVTPSSAPPEAPPVPTPDQPEHSEPPEPEPDEPEPDDDDGDGDDGHDPPGLEDNPGLDDKGGEPPGLGDKGGEPPGQQKDKGGD